MIWKFASVASLCLAASSLTAWVVLARTRNNPVVFTTTPKPVKTRLQLSSGLNFEVRGHASLTVNMANADDTLTGTFVYALPDDARAKIAQAVNKTLKDVPANVVIDKVSASFRHGTACPLVQLNVPVKEAESVGGKLQFDRVLLDIQETPAQINQLFCSWTRQINAKRQRQGIIAAINRLIQPDIDSEETKR